MTALRLFGGKGGVGKTTLAAAHAVSRADAGEKVLVLSTDPAHSLGDAFGVRLGAKPKRLARNLFAQELDADRALARWLDDRRGLIHTIAERGTYLDDEDIDRLLGLALPGVDELAALLELAALAEADAHDAIVVDTAPTGHALRLLQMPETLRGLAQLLGDMQAKHRFVAEALRGRARADAADALIDEMARQADALLALLRDPERARFTWVTLAEPLALAETRDGLRALGELGVRVEEVLVNRLVPRPERTCTRCDGVRTKQAQVLAELRRERSLPMRVVDARDSEPRGLAGLRALGRSIRVDRVGSTRSRARGRPHPGDAALSELAPDGVRLLLFGGKGGVGKTTCAAAAALEIAARDADRRVLALSIDPAHSLGDALGVELSGTPRPVTENLFACELDANAALEANRAQYRRSVDDLFDALRGGRRLDASLDRQVVQDLVELQPPGMDELFAMLALIDSLFVGVASRPRPFDLVILDTAPTGHTLRLLGLPKAALAWVQALLSMLLKYRQVVSLGKLAEDLVKLSRELKQLQALLTDPAQTRFIAVTRPGELPHAETRRLLRALGALRVPEGGVLVNACTLPGCKRCSRAARVEARFRSRRAYAPARAPVLWAPALDAPPSPAELRGFASAWSRA